MEEAEKVMAAARVKAKEINVAMCIAVVNEAGFLTCFIRSEIRSFVPSNLRSIKHIRRL